MKTYEWTTAKGAKVEIVVAQQYKEQTDEMEITKVGMRIEKFTVNGTEYFGRISYRGGAHYIMFKTNGQQAGVEIPEEIYEDMMKETREREAKARAEMEKYYKEEAIISRFEKGTY